jgi:hypothetical protein
MSRLVVKGQPGGEFSLALRSAAGSIREMFGQDTEGKGGLIGPGVRQGDMNSVVLLRPLQIRISAEQAYRAHIAGEIRIAAIQRMEAQFACGPAKRDGVEGTVVGRVTDVVGSELLAIGVQRRTRYLGGSFAIEQPRTRPIDGFAVGLQPCAYCRRILRTSSGIVPSDLGPTFKSRLPFLLTTSTSSSMSDFASQYLSFCMYPQDRILTEVSVCQGRRRIPSSLPRSISSTAAFSGKSFILYVRTTGWWRSAASL